MNHIHVSGRDITDFRSGTLGHCEQPVRGKAASTVHPKFVSTLALAAAVLFVGWVEAACQSFVVVGSDASYLVIQPEDWTVFEVGNYWGVGIWRVDDIVPGSSHEKPAFKTGRFEDIFTREPVVSQPVPADGRPNAVVVLKQSPAPRDSGWPPHHYQLEESEGENSPLWVHWLGENTLMRESEIDDATAIYHVSAELEVLNVWDIATETIESEFASPNPARNILFAGGSRWLQQLARDPTAEEPEPSTRFRLIDTTTGEVLREAELDAPGGALIEEMQCDPDTPRAVIAGPRRIWLLDPQTLTVIAENEVPFERNYFVFE